jgi:nicotinamide-nucleotide amidase
VYAVPGVPAEMRSMIEGQVLEELVAAAGELPQRVTRSLVVVGLGEPRVAELLAPVEQSMVGRGRLSYLPRPAEVEVRLVLTGAGAETLAAASVALARNLLGDALAAEDQALEDAVVGLLRSRHQTVATAESLTAGMLAAALVSVAGASEVMRGGVVAYATDLKAVLADVPTEVLERHGAIAAVTAAAMARGARARCRADLGVATTGVAGPDPQEGHHPGTFHVAVASADVTRVGSYAPTAQRRDRETIRRLAVVRALDLLRRTAAGLGPATGESRPRPTR